MIIVIRVANVYGALPKYQAKHFIQTVLCGNLPFLTCFLGTLCMWWVQEESVHETPLMGDLHPLSGTIAVALGYPLCSSCV